MKTKYGKPSKKKFETFCPSECFTLESGGSICSSKASKLENPSVLIQSLDSAASPSQSTIKIYIPWLFKLIIWKWKVKFKLHLFTILLSCRFSSKFILKLRDPVILWHRFLKWFWLCTAQFLFSQININVLMT